MFMLRSEPELATYWKGCEDIYILAKRALVTGESLDQLLLESRASTDRILVARSSGSLSHLPK